MEIGESLEQTGLKAENLKFIDILSGKNLYFKDPNGDEVYNVICVFMAAGISGAQAIYDGESLDLRYFSINNLPSRLDEKAKIIIEKIFI